MVSTKCTSAFKVHCSEGYKCKLLTPGWALAGRTLTAAKTMSFYLSSWCTLKWRSVITAFRRSLRKEAGSHAPEQMTGLCISRQQLDATRSLDASILSFGFRASRSVEKRPALMLLDVVQGFNQVSASSRWLVFLLSLKMEHIPVRYCMKGMVPTKHYTYYWSL